jgi:hypothetical protein
VIWHCPYCGHNLLTPINNGITSCQNCCRIFDSSPYHRILSLGWLARKQNVCSAEQLIQHGFSEEEANFVMDNADLTHQEFVQVVNGLGISKVA